MLVVGGAVNHRLAGRRRALYRPTSLFRFIEEAQRQRAEWERANLAAYRRRVVQPEGEARGSADSSRGRR